MILRKQHVAVFLFVALLFGAIGVYAGATLEFFKKGDQLVQPSENETNENKNENNDGKTVEQIDEMAKVSQAFRLIKEHYIEDVEDVDLIEGAIQGMVEVLGDPYSSYMDAELTERFTEQIESSFEGIGAEVSMMNGKVTIVAPIKDSPAEAAGLRPNDQIIKIDHESIEGLDLHEAVEKIRGEKGTEVVLEIERPGASEPFEITLVRDEIPIETVYSSIEEVDGKKTGIIEITTFAETTAEEFETQLNKLEADGISGLVIDVRGNPGGLLNAVEDILGHLIPKDVPYIQIEDQQGQKTPYYTKLKDKKDYPISILIDEGSASASEILAVAMKEIDYDVVGTPSFGKGTVQNAIPLGDNSTLKLTFYKWLSPLGNWIHEVGVEPTIEVKQPDYYYSNPIQLDRPLEFNHTSEKVENIQIMLSGVGYETDRMDGYFDEATEAAVKAFQKDHNIEPNGKIDETTAGAIEATVIDRIRSGEDDQQLQEALNKLYK